VSAQAKRDWSVGALLAALLGSAMANATLDTVLGLEVYSISGRPLDLGLLGLASFAPAALLVLVTGSVADRFDRRHVAACGLLGEAVVAALIFVYLGVAHPSVAPILGFAFLFGIARAFTGPAIRALPADIVAPERVPWVVARTSITWQIATILGPVLGGFLYAAGHRFPYPAIIVMSASGAAFMLAVRSTHPKPIAEAELCATVPALEPERTPARATFHDAIEGLRFVRRNPIVLGAISLDLFAVLFGGAVALLPALAATRYHVGAVGVGWLRAAGGMGAATVTAILAIKPIRQRVGRNLISAVAIFGIATIVLGATRTFAIAFVAMFVLSGADSISVFIRATLVPLVTPTEKRGRVLAVENVFIGASNELGAFESGVAGQWLGAGGAVVLGGAATLAVAGTWAALFPALRTVDHFPTPVESAQDAQLSHEPEVVPVDPVVDDLVARERHDVDERK
jgi:MFS family permease